MYVCMCVYIYIYMYVQMHCIAKIVMTITTNFIASRITRYHNHRLPPLLVVLYAHLTDLISFCRERGLLWLIQEPLPSLARTLWNQLRSLTSHSLLTAVDQVLPLLALSTLLLP